MFLKQKKKGKIFWRKIGDWGLGFGVWVLGIGDWAKSPIPNPNPQSPIPNPHGKCYIFLN